MCMKLTSAHIPVCGYAPVSGKCIEHPIMRASKLLIKAKLVQPHYPLCMHACLSHSHYLSMYRICPSGFILSSTLGTVTYWNSPSLALGKYTWKKRKWRCQNSRSHDKIRLKRAFQYWNTIQLCNTSGFHIAWTNLGSLRSKASLIA